MKKALLLLMLFIRIPSGHAQTETYKNVDSTLYAYYRWCNNNIRDSVVLLKADTLFRLAGEKNDIRMQAVALSFKADHYYFNNEPDSLKAWIPRVQAFARANDQPTYYFFTWSRLILYYTKHGQYTLAQYELERYMAQAEQDDYKPAIAEAYKQLGHIYRTRGLKEERRRLLPQGDRLHRREQPQQILAAYSLFRAGHRPHRHRTVRRSRRRARKKARRGSPCPNTSGR